MTQKAPWFITTFFLMAGTAVAHHSFALFDMQHEVTITGTVKDVQWTNPHCWIQVVVPTATGSSEEWSIETMSPGGLKNLGWTPRSLKAGDHVVAHIKPMRNGSKGGALVSLDGPTGTLVGFPATDPSAGSAPAR